MIVNNLQLTDAEVIFLRQSLRDALTYAEMELEKVEKLYPISREMPNEAHIEAKQRLARAEDAKAILENRIDILTRDNAKG